MNPPGAALKGSLKKRTEIVTVQKGCYSRLEFHLLPPPLLNKKQLLQVKKAEVERLKDQK